MTTYFEKRDRVFHTKEEEDRKRLIRRRSPGRLKEYRSNTDIRTWCLDPDQRRRQILEVRKSYVS